MRLLKIFVIAVVALRGRPHVVSEIVESELVVRSVGDVAFVRSLAIGRLHLTLDRANRQSERHVERTHPLHIAPGQIVVDRNDMHAFAFQRVEIGRQRSHERLAFAGDHFGDRTAMKHDAAHELNIEMAHAERSPTRLATDGKSLDQQVVERLARSQPLAELEGLLPQLRVGHRLIRRLQGIDGRDRRLQLLQVSSIRRAEQAGQ